MPESSLLTVEGWGHTSTFLSLCADQVVSRYLLTRATPPEGTTCAQDVGPFEAAGAQGAGARLRARERARAEAISEMTLPAER